MKQYPARSSIIVATLFLAGVSGHADEAYRANLIKERDSVLSQILAEREGNRATGMADEEAIAAAQLALYSFRRDIATTSAEKIKNQELIVRIYEKRQELVKAKLSTGLASNMQILEATVPLLEAKQILEEIRVPLAGPALSSAGYAQAAAQIEISVSQEGVVALAGQPLSVEELAKHLATIAKKEATRPVVTITSPENAPLEVVTLVMDSCRQNGFNKIRLRSR